MESKDLKEYIIRERPITDDIFENFFNDNINLDLEEPIILDAKHAFNVYSNRYIIQKTITNANIKGYERLLKNLKELNENILIYQLNTKIGFISCFLNYDEKKLLGVLWNPNKKKS